MAVKLFHRQTLLDVLANNIKKDKKDAPPVKLQEKLFPIKHSSHN